MYIFVYLGPKVAVTQKPPVDKTTTPKQGGEATTRPTRGPPVGDCSGRFDAVASAKSSFGLSFTIAFSGKLFPESMYILGVYLQASCSDYTFKFLSMSNSTFPLYFCEWYMYETFTTDIYISAKEVFQFAS